MLLVVDLRSVLFLKQRQGLMAARPPCPGGTDSGSSATSDKFVRARLTRFTVLLWNTWRFKIFVGRTDISFLHCSRIDLLLLFLYPIFLSDNETISWDFLCLANEMDTIFRLLIIISAFVLIVQITIILSTFYIACHNNPRSFKITVKTDKGMNFTLN